MLQDTSLHPFTAGGRSSGELGWESPTGTGCRVRQHSTHHLGCSRRQRALHVPPGPSPQLCAPPGIFLCRKQAWLDEKPGPKVSNCGLGNRKDLPREARSKAEGIPTCRRLTGCSFAVHCSPPCPPLTYGCTSPMQSPGHVPCPRARLSHPGPSGTQSSLLPITSYSP